MNIQKCPACGKDIDLDIKESFITIIYLQMHYYICSTRCIIDFYKPNIIKK